MRAGAILTGRGVGSSLHVNNLLIYKEIDAQAAPARAAKKALAALAERVVWAIPTGFPGNEVSMTLFLVVPRNHPAAGAFP